MKSKGDALTFSTLARSFNARQLLKRHQAIVAGCIGALIALASGGWKATPYNNYVLLAQAFLSGHVAINWPGAFIDALGWHGERYIIEAPVPSILLLPLVAVFGAATNQTIFSDVLCGIAVGAFWELLRREDVGFAARISLAAFFFAGTDLWWCATLGDVWFLAHVSVVAFTMLALLELRGRRRGWVVALLGACAVESRFSLLAAMPVYAMLLLRDHNGTRKFGAFCLTLVPIVALWVWYNEARWGLPYDIGYQTWFHEDSAGSPFGSPFALHYLGYQLRSFFAQPPIFAGQYPFAIAPISGLALEFTSPALVWALFAKRPQRFVTAMWVATALTAVPSLLYYVDGYAQFGMRHALDFEPFLVVLMAFAARNGMPRWMHALCWYSAVVGAWGVWYWRIVLHR